MKKLIFKLKDGLFFLLGFVFVIFAFGIAFASYSTMTNVSSGGILTSTGHNLLFANIDDLNARVNSGITNLSNLDAKANLPVPTGAIMSFNLASCPSGWSEYTPAYGRFLRGIDKSGASIDPDGQRANGATQGDLVKAHSHVFPDYFNAGGSYNGAGVQGIGTLVSGSQRSLYTNVGVEARPKNVAVLYCVKN